MLHKAYAPLLDRGKGPAVGWPQRVMDGLGADNQHTTGSVQGIDVHAWGDGGSWLLNLGEGICNHSGDTDLGSERNGDRQGLAGCCTAAPQRLLRTFVALGTVRYRTRIKLPGLGGSGRQA